MIKIEKNVIAALKNESGIAEIISFPDSGSTSACLELASSLIDENEVSVVFFPNHNVPNPEYVKSIISDKKLSRIIIIQYDIKNITFVIETIEKLAHLAKFFIIDDFYSCILYKNYSLIRDLLKRFRLASKQQNGLICLVNQYRYAIKNNEYDFGGNAQIKSLYSEHITPFIFAQIQVQKDESHNIIMSLLQKKNKKQPAQFSQLLNSLSFS